MLLLRFPELKEKVLENLRAKNVGEAVLKSWLEISNQNFELGGEDDDLDFLIAGDVGESGWK